MSVIKRIDITERNETTPSNLSSDSGTAYVPGLARKGEVGVPKYFQNEADFITEFGDEPVVFGAYVSSSDTAVDSEKKYYTATSVSEPSESDIDDYYVRENIGTSAEPNYVYIKAYVDEFKTTNSYYIASEVAEPTGNPSTSNYLELGTVGNNGIVNYDKDLSYVYARFLLRQGLPVIYERVSDINAVVAIYDAMSSSVSTEGFNKLTDPGDYNVKFITSGAYPTYYCTSGSSATHEYNSDIMHIMIDVAHTRGDAVALIDHQNVDAFDDIAPTNDEICKSITEIVTIEDDDRVEMGEYGAVYTPWAQYKLAYPFGDTVLPASYGYLTAYAKSVITNASYLAVAGVARGQVPNIDYLDTKRVLTNAMADSYQNTDKRAVNAITNISPYGLTIWGNRTLYKNTDLDAYSFMNLRSLLCDLKKSIRDISLTLLFEQNNDVLWLKFKSRVSAVLDRMVAGNGLKNYALVKVTTDKKGNPIPRYRLAVEVIVNPVYAVEEISVGVVVTDEEITVS